MTQATALTLPDKATQAQLKTTHAMPRTLPDDTQTVLTLGDEWTCLLMPNLLQHTGTRYSSRRSAWLTAVALSACLSTLSLSHAQSSFILNLKCKCVPP
jgi:hypothetical protein